MGDRTRRGGADSTRPRDDQSGDLQGGGPDPRTDTADSTRPADPQSGPDLRGPKPPPTPDSTPLVFRGETVPTGMAPPPFAEPHGQQVTQTGPSATTYQFRQDEPVEVAAEDAAYFLAHDTLDFEVAPHPSGQDAPAERRSAPADDTPTAGARS